MDAFILVAIVALLGFIATLIFEKASSNRALCWVKLAILSVASIWLVYVIASGWKSGIFVVLLLTFFVASAFKAAWDLWSVASGSEQR